MAQGAESSTRRFRVLRLAHRLKLDSGLAPRIIAALAGAGCLSVLVAFLGAGN
jgi:hypothetical protein